MLNKKYTAFKTNIYKFGKVAYSLDSIRKSDVAGKQILVFIENKYDHTAPEFIELIKFLRESQAKTTIVSHLEEPQKKIDKKHSLSELAKSLKNLISKDINFLSIEEENIADEMSTHSYESYDTYLEYTAKPRISKSKPGSVIMLDNLHFDHKQNNSDSVLLKHFKGFFDGYLYLG